MKNYKQIIDTILDISERHYKVNNVGFGSTTEIGLDDTHHTPIVWLQPIPIDLGKTNNGYGSIVRYKFDLICMGQVMKDNDNRKDMFNDTFLILMDIIHKLYESDYNVEFNTTFNPFLENYDYETVGWITTLTIQDNYTLDICNLPFSV